MIVPRPLQSGDESPHSKRAAQGDASLALAQHKGCPAGAKAVHFPPFWSAAIHCRFAANVAQPEDVTAYRAIRLTSRSEPTKGQRFRRRPVLLSQCGRKTSGKAVMNHRTPKGTASELTFRSTPCPQRICVAAIDARGRPDNAARIGPSPNGVSNSKPCPRYTALQWTIS